jgi:hypothetical protein
MEGVNQSFWRREKPSSLAAQKLFFRKARV